MASRVKDRLGLVGPTALPDRLPLLPSDVGRFIEGLGCSLQFGLGESVVGRQQRTVGAHQDIGLVPELPRCRVPASFQVRDRRAVVIESFGHLPLAQTSGTAPSAQLLTQGTPQRCDMRGLASHATTPLLGSR